MPWRRDSRAALIQKTGQNKFPAIEYEDGSVYKAESQGIAARIRAGELGTSAPAR